MLLLLDIPDKKAAKTIKSMLKVKHATVKTKELSASDAETLMEVKEIAKAKKLAAKILQGKVATRPVRDFLNEL